MPPQPICKDVLEPVTQAIAGLMVEFHPSRDFAILDASDMRISESDRLTLVFQVAAYSPGHFGARQEEWMIGLTVRPFRSGYGDLITSGGPVVIIIENIDYVGEILQGSDELRSLINLYY